MTVLQFALPDRNEISRATRRLEDWISLVVEEWALFFPVILAPWNDARTPKRAGCFVQEVTGIVPGSLFFCKPLTCCIGMQDPFVTHSGSYQISVHSLLCHTVCSAKFIVIIPAFKFSKIIPLRLLGLFSARAKAFPLYRKTQWEGLGAHQNKETRTTIHWSYTERWYQKKAVGHFWTSADWHQCFLRIR